MSWNSNDPQVGTFSTIFIPHNFTYGTNFPSYHPHPPLSNDPSPPANIIPTKNFTPRNNSPKLVPHVPTDPDPDPSLPRSSLSDSSESWDP